MIKLTNKKGKQWKTKTGETPKNGRKILQTFVFRRVWKTNKTYYIHRLPIYGRDTADRGCCRRASGRFRRYIDYIACGTDHCFEKATAKRTSVHRFRP